MKILTNVRRDHHDPGTRDRPCKSALCRVLRGQKMDSRGLMSGVSSCGPGRAHDALDGRVQKKVPQKHSQWLRNVIVRRGGYCWLPETKPPAPDPRLKSNHKRHSGTYPSPRGRGISPNTIPPQQTGTHSQAMARRLRPISCSEVRLSCLQPSLLRSAEKPRQEK